MFLYKNILPTYFLGLGLEFYSIVYIISAESKSKSLQQIYSLLLTHENLLEMNFAISADGTQSTANLVFGNIDKKQNNFQKRLPFTLFTP